MGYVRLKPEHLGAKLRQIRLSLGLSQSEMLSRLGVGDIIVYSQISGYESGKREPPLPVLLRYARVANVAMEAIVDDELDLPDELPSRAKSDGVARKSAKRSKSKS